MVLEMEKLLMKKYLPIGSVVQLKNGNRKIMIINRFPLFRKESEIGYFDYSACLYPNGSVDNQAFFFNQEDIDRVWFEGYFDESEEQYQKIMEGERDKIDYPHFSLPDVIE